ncbi:hypothetical protein [Nostoc favosum]|uniref:Uncharacterized protein n=1 Tax=Nostoc favosum CHAB5714 TaxID=2780399 RepID=A0ABS8IG52_9NOSO|nr:hypothetical protein [Nostoc favosum]MCC5603230.1 hypothetical protein [Nostoc favosum CHAB5714]
MTTISNDLQLKPKWSNCQQTWIKQPSGEAKHVGVSPKPSRKNKGNHVSLEMLKLCSLLSIAPN